MADHQKITSIFFITCETMYKSEIFNFSYPSSVFHGLCAAGLPPARGSMADGVSDKAFLISTKGFKH